jgi:AcrR family transcriptional regulator
VQRVAKIVRVVDLREAGKNRRRRQILDAARELIEADGREALSMRRLAECAQLSTRTLYNLYGAKEDILYALMSESMREVDARLAKLSMPDPLDRSRASISMSIDQLCARTAFNRALYRGFELDAHRARNIEVVSLARNRQKAVLEAAQAQGLLLRTVPARVLAHHIIMGYGNVVRLWCREVLDSAQLRAHVLHMRALCLLAVATPATRIRFEREIESLAPDMQLLVDRLDELAGAPPAAPALETSEAADSLAR